MNIVMVFLGLAMAKIRLDVVEDTIYFNSFDAVISTEFNRIVCFEQVLNSICFVPMPLLFFFLIGPDAQLQCKERTNLSILSCIKLKNFWMLYSSTVSYQPISPMSLIHAFIYAGFMLLKSFLHWSTYTCLVLYIEI